MRARLALASFILNLKDLGIDSKRDFLHEIRQMALNGPEAAVPATPPFSRSKFRLIQMLNQELVGKQGGGALLLSLELAHLGLGYSNLLLVL